ncbi:MAG: IclR family transcriptional regulator [Thermodesulfobacteriota bacterium]|nr:IclR family transcriptional regulator [Thermodesulfobacteriota bacterium]
MTEPKKYFFISSLAKGLDVLELLAEKGESSVSDVAKTLGHNRTGSHRLLATLKELGYVEQNLNNKYHLTFKMLELGMKLSNRLGIRTLALPYMEQLSTAFGETINLGVRDGFNILHLEKIDSTEILRMDSPIGSTAPVYCSALGKAITAFMPGGLLASFLSEIKITPHGPNCVSSAKELETELAKVKNQGFAMDDEELASGLRCVAAPVFDHAGAVRYSISVSGPAMRLTKERVQQIQKKLKNSCHELSKQLKQLNQ